MPLTIELARSAPDRRGRLGRRRRRRPDRGRRRRLGLPAGQGFEAQEGRRARALPGDGGTTTYVVGLGPADRGGRRRAALRRRRARPGRQAARLARRRPARRRSPTAPTRPPAPRPSPRAWCSAATSSRRFKSEPKPAELAPRRHRRRAAASAPRTPSPGASPWPRRCAGRATSRTSPAGRSRPPSWPSGRPRWARRPGFEVTVWDEKEIRKQKLGGLLGVNRGSEQAPRFLRLEYAPDKPRGTVALVGKGITFDSGRPVPQAGRRHGRHEGRHGRRGRGARHVPTPSRTLGRQGAGARLPARSPTT